MLIGPQSDKNYIIDVVAYSACPVSYSDPGSGYVVTTKIVSRAMLVSEGRFDFGMCWWIFVDFATASAWYFDSCVYLLAPLGCEIQITD
jgi:hypothetical protein